MVVAGTGLGLSIVRRAATIHGAVIEAQNKPRIGAVITVSFLKEYKDDFS